MEINRLIAKLRNYVEKYKYAVLVVVIGSVLLLIPGKSSRMQETVSSSSDIIEQETLTQDSLTQILQSVAGAGRVRVLLSVATGEETVYEDDTEASTTGESGNHIVKTVIITDSQRSETGLIRQVNPGTYKGAIVVCEGADSPAVRLAVTQAVSKITGLGTDAICVLKMQ